MTFLWNNPSACIVLHIPPNIYTMKDFLKNWDDPISKERMDLVFNNRNHEYGAYAIRRDYHQSVLKAFFFTCFFLTLLLSLPALLRCLSPAEVLIKSKPNEDPFHPREVILPEKIIPPSSKTIPEFQKPRGPAQQFTHLIVSDKDSLEKALTQEELLKLNLAHQTTKSDSVEVKEELPDKEIKNYGGEIKTHTWVEEMPSFPGGEEAMLNFLRSNIHYPPVARESNLTGIVYISFIVDSKGAIDQINLVRGIGGGCEEEAIRVIKKMPQWRPGKQNGKAVNVQYMLPVAFRLK